ncbi:iron-containing alcohol dehydrogenase [Alkalibacterium olivapovliticus]|uniref:Iron-containing alcohol dehydrogenase-like protein n=1 Tax=Alkalibacterium olivapovliticus TaxID=99907 RepID=A0A2T0VX38_9LACT|nr:iron-containing alcohol dehydrogenase-like protein [Alkalibacterium olivapovliticus]
MVKDFQLRNDTKLLFRNDPSEDLQKMINGKKVMFVFGGGSVKKNRSFEDVKKTVLASGGVFHAFGSASREFSVIEEGIRFAQNNQIELIIGAGGASIMDAAKLIAFGVYHEAGLWDYLKNDKNP